MKRVLFSTLALSFGLSIQAQFTTQISPSHEGGQWFFGVGVGFHSNTMRYSDLDEELFSDHKNLNSGVFTVFAQYDFGKERHFSVRPELSLLRRGGRIVDIGKDMYDENIDGIHYALKSRFVDIRVPLVYSFMKAESRIRPYVYIAPVIGFATRGTIRMQEDFANGEYNMWATD